MEFLYGSLDLSTFLLDLKMYIRRTQLCDQIHEELCDTPKCHGLLCVPVGYACCQETNDENRFEQFQIR